MEQIKDYFDRYPHNDEVFEADGVLFHTRGAAESYTKGDVVKYTRAKVMAEPLAPEGENGEAAKTAAIELLKTSDVEALDYNAMKALSKDLQLITADKKAETLKAALIEFKNTLTEE